MLDVSAIHPFEACAAFAVRFMRHLAGSDLAAAEALIDVNETGIPFADSFLPPVPGPGGFSYADPDQISDWYYVCRADKKGNEVGI